MTQMNADEVFAIAMSSKHRKGYPSETHVSGGAQIGPRRQRGYSREGRLLVVNFVQRGEIIRIINARQADRHERNRHEEENL